MVTQKQKIIPAVKHDESILVVKRNHLFPDGAWQGLKPVDFDHYLHIIECKQEFHSRSLMETDETYKQIIPYLIFEHENKYFLMQRQSNASEKRLQNKYTLGIGGHIRREDLQSHSFPSQASVFAKATPDRQDEQGGKNSHPIFNWANREFHEEVNYDGSFTIEPLGILNDDSNAVGKVHIGFVFLLHGNSDQISIKSELKSGRLVDLAECTTHMSAMEQWSQRVLAFLQNRQEK